MNRDPEDIQRQILDLLQDLLPTASLTDAEVAQQVLGCETIFGSTLKPPTLSTPSGHNPSISGHSGLNRSNERAPLFELGDVPAVQDRFHALLKNRLQSEIQQNPPLFPWESELHDYETGVAYEGVPTASSSGSVASATGVKIPAWLWIRHLDTLQLPIQMPDAMLAQLLNRCETVVQSAMREGAKLVEAVEDLFPGQGQALNYLAGLVITSPARSGGAAIAPSTEANFPASFEAAAPAQQMVVSLLAAREILNALSLTVSTQQPIVERQWMTDSGALSLRTMYQPSASPATVRVVVNLPKSGSLTLQGQSVQSVTQRSGAGCLSVEVFEPENQKVYPLEVRIAGHEEAPLTFAVQITDP